MLSTTIYNIIFFIEMIWLKKFQITSLSSIPPPHPSTSLYCEEDFITVCMNWIVKCSYEYYYYIKYKKKKKTKN